MRHRLCEEHSDMVVVERVHDVAAPPGPNHEAQVAQHPQLLRNRRRLQVEIVRELADRHRARRKSTEDPHPARGRQRMHRLRNRVGILRRHERQLDLVATTHQWSIV